MIWLCKVEPTTCSKIQYRDEIDPIILNDIDECNEWIVGQVDDDNDNGEGEMSWFSMMIYTRRQATNKRKQSSSGGIVIIFPCF